ncbi:unnamed protein product [Jaminaea pallidilutea]
MAAQLRGMANIHALINKAQAGTLGHNDLRRIVAFCLQALHLRELVMELQVGGQANVVLLDRILSAFEPVKLHSIAEAIEDTVDWSRSKDEHRVCVKAGVDDQLDRWRQTYAGLPSLLDTIGRQIRNQYESDLTDKANVAYFPQLGFLLALRLDESQQTPDDISAPDTWSLHFASDVSAYYKSPEMQDLDHHIGDLHSFIADREVDIAHALITDVAQAGRLLVAVAELCAQLDW